MKHLCFTFLIFFLPLFTEAAGTDTLRVNTFESQLVAKKYLQVYEDASNKMSIEEIKDLDNFKSLRNDVPNLGISNSTFWIKFLLYNNTPYNYIFIRVPYPNLDRLTLYYTFQNSTYKITSGSDFPLHIRKYKHQSFIFKIDLPAQKATNIYIKIKSKEQILVPIFVGTEENILHDTLRDDFLFGIYLGVVLVMLFYNLFIYFSVRDKSYLYYVFYIFCVGLTQFTLQGYGYKFLWNNLTYVTDQSICWTGALSGIATAMFLREFLHTREKATFFDRLLSVYIGLYLISILLSIFKAYNASYILIDLVALVGSLSIWFVGLILSIKGFRPAKFFIIAWTFFLLSVVIYVFKDFGVVSYNTLTNNILLIGSSIEVTLLSFALADRINVFKKEKEESQAEALRASMENERLIREQNIILEAKVLERTHALQIANNDLNIALKNLKEAQSQLVEAEKMASLGQLTAGVAHEINNPINFVKANIKPLQMDILDLRELIRRYEALHQEDPANIPEKLKLIQSFKNQIDLEYISNEIDHLLNGIEDGAIRTAEIVSGLRNFSRLDESELKAVDVHEGIESTLILLRSSLPPYIKIIKNFQARSKLECYPGKLNQVFMNILTNAIQAIKAKEHQAEESITITTTEQDGHLIISIKDTGTGIKEEIMPKIFDPFFTTKDVGEGTGLGLSIVFNIIEKHHGKLTVHTTYGKGAEFILTLPLIQPEAA